MPTASQLKGKLKFYTKPYGRQWKWRYQVHGHFHEPILKIPKALEGKNIEIIDPLHPKPVEYEKWIPPRRHPLLEKFFPNPKPSDHQNYHVNPIFLYDKKIKLHATIDQACLLTKSMPVFELPGKIKSTIGQFKINNEESCLKSYIKQALAFNPTKDECSVIDIPTDNKFKVNREWATKPYDQMSILYDNMIRLTNMCAKNPLVHVSRNVMQNTPFHTTFKRVDENIHIRGKSDFIIYSKNAQKPICDEKLISESVNYKFIDMYPIFPTVDLSNEHIYEDDTTIGWLNNAKNNNNNKDVNQFNNIHTVFHINDDDFSVDADISRLIMYAFGYAYAQAQLNKEKVLLNNNLELQNPFVINLISLKDQRLNYVCFQLNTLKLNDDNGVKNVVFIDKNNELYLNRPNVDKLPYPSRKDIQRYALRKLEYNQNAFDKFKSIVLNDTL